MIKFISLTVYYASDSIPRDEGPDWILICCIFLPLIAGISYLIYITRHHSDWEKGVFPENLKFNRDNLIEAYICLAALMMQKDRRNLQDKMKYMNSFFNKNFPESNYGFAESLKYSYENPIKPKTVAIWINRHIKDSSKKSQILYFLAGLSMQDGQLINTEYNILKEITPLIGLKISDLDSIIAMYDFKKEEKSEEEKIPYQKSMNTSALAEIAHKVIGLPNTASITEIKAAYRKLIKIHHPDRFPNESQEQINLAHERFLKIQDAYELLEKLKG